MASKLDDPSWRRERARTAARSRTSGPYHLAKVREIVERTRADQGLPPVVTDELTLGRVADLFKLAPSTPRIPDSPEAA